MKVQWLDHDKDSRELFKEYSLSFKQMVFSGHPYYMVNNPLFHDATPVVLYDQQQVIGFFMFVEASDYTESLSNADEAIYIRGLSIDSKHQGQGYFKHVLNAIEQVARNKGKKYIVMTTNKLNKTAYQTFLHKGFEKYEPIGYYGYRQLLHFLKKRVVD
ncbi:GNAT family N-acetyltransferase [Abyssicoccus albus]|uniref:Acetyltransferase (GNAT) family protein n=1 Tax=Abyssicoccus albus TaxID=1817405 RepID=A0A3N5BJ89_9BACL|nr:GNAT family N-acetyltransferase [Abyssicoccus albus]RPF57914.1 acetyltransferase (GNAT) family protein [Abyssicoccus albus]